MLKDSLKHLSLLLIANSLPASDIGSLLFHGNCVTCHHKHKNLSAPSMGTIKANYIKAFPIKKDFVEYMSEWVVKPNKESSIMLGAIKKYDLMPELGFDKSTTKEIAEYIYRTDFANINEIKSPPLLR